MKKNNKLVIFDFCDTLVNFQSADEFCRYILKKESRFIYLMMDKFFQIFYFYRILSKLQLEVFSQKYFLLKGLKGLSVSRIDDYGIDYVREVISKQLNEKVYQRFLDHIKNGDVVVINSGGYEPYLKYFSSTHNVALLYSTRFKYVKNIFTGEIDGNDCLGFEKVERMKDADLLERCYSDIFVYSDSVTDLPIFNLATHKVAVIKYNLSPMWCQTNFEIIKVK